MRLSAAAVKWLLGVTIALGALQFVIGIASAIFRSEALSIVQKIFLIPFVFAMLACFVLGRLDSRDRKTALKADRSRVARILSSGVSAQAEVLEVRGTRSDSGNCTAQLTLRVQRPDGSVFQAEASKWLEVPYPGLVYKVGMTIPVRLDPDDPAHVEVPDPPPGLYGDPHGSKAR